MFAFAFLRSDERTSGEERRSRYRAPALSTSEVDCSIYPLIFHFSIAHPWRFGRGGPWVMAVVGATQTAIFDLSAIPQCTIFAVT
jgi:hypothetical protein